MTQIGVTRRLSEVLTGLDLLWQKCLRIGERGKRGQASELIIDTQGVQGEIA
jgi:hypothetical protein